MTPAPLPRVFDGETAFVVAGGPSLIGFDFGRLAGRNIVAINRAHEVLPLATVLWWSDAAYWRRASESLSDHRAPFKATCQVDYVTGHEPPDAVTRYNFTGCLGFDPDPRCLRHGNNSAYAALHLATHLGARRIVLLGVDMRHGAGGESHFHSGHGNIHLDVTLSELMLPMFASIAEPLAALGVEVINASPDSRLELWPRVSIEEGLAHG